MAESAPKRARAERTFLFSSESVTEGHLDKLCDQISDAVLDTCLAQDPNSKVACETIIKNNMVMIAGEISTEAHVDYEKVVRDVLGHSAPRPQLNGSGRGEGTAPGGGALSAPTCEVLVRVNRQSPDIAGGICAGKADLEIGAGDQGIIFGYATDETEDFMPLTHAAATQIARRLADARKTGRLWWLRPQGKTEVTVEYLQHRDGSLEPLRLHAVVVTTQHAEPGLGQRSVEVPGHTGPDETAPDLEEMRRLITEVVIRPALAEVQLRGGRPASDLFLDSTRLHINPSGKITGDNPLGDHGMTGRKVIADSYGGWGAHGGGAFSGKDPTKVDRSAACICRQMAKSAVSSGLCRRALVQLSYAIAVAKPICIYVETYGTERGTLTPEDIADILKLEFDCRPGAVTQCLGLREPKYQETAAYGHFGRKPYKKGNYSLFEWERVKDLSKYVNMSSEDVSSALRASDYLSRWVD